MHTRAKADITLSYGSRCLECTLLTAGLDVDKPGCEGRDSAWREVDRGGALYISRPVDTRTRSLALLECPMNVFSRKWSSVAVVHVRGLDTTVTIHAFAKVSLGRS